MTPTWPSDAQPALAAGGLDVSGEASQIPHSPGLKDPGERDPKFEAAVEDYRRLVGSNTPFLFPRLEDQVRRWLGVAPTGVGSFVLTCLTGIGIRLGVAIAATALVGDWAGIPWARWVAILLFLGLWDAVKEREHPPIDVTPLPSARRRIEYATALVPAIAHTSDLQELVDSHRRWYRLPLSVAFGVTVTVAMLLAALLTTPTGFEELPIGSVVLLAFLIYDVAEGVVYGGNLIDLPFMVREAKYEHHLFWPSPADTPAIQTQMWALRIWPVWFGVQVTVYLVLALVLVSWSSPLVPPLAFGFVVVGYLTTFVSALNYRASIQKIVRRSKDRHVENLQRRIESFESRYTELTPDELAQLRGLIDLHNLIRDAPTAPTPTRTAIRAAVGLIIPTILFLITVFGEVYAERFFDAILP